MRGNTFARLWTGVVAAIGALLMLPCAAQAQAVPPGQTARQAEAARQAQAALLPKAERSAVFSEALARAKESSRPVVVFGTSDTCSYCVAFKQGLAAQPELQDLLSQYVSIEVPFGGRDFVSIYWETVRQDPSSLPAIAQPAVFMFTSKGDVVYAGPNIVGGMKAGDEFKNLLVAGLEKNKVVPRVARPKAVPRLWKSKLGQHSVTATLISFDGKSAQLKTDAGKTITVALDALSAEDQQFLKTAKPQN